MLFMNMLLKYNTRVEGYNNNYRNNVQHHRAFVNMALYKCCILLFYYYKVHQIIVNCDCGVGVRPLPSNVVHAFERPPICNIGTNYDVSAEDYITIMTNNIPAALECTSFTHDQDKW